MKKEEAYKEYYYRKEERENKIVGKETQSERWMQRFIDRFLLCVLPQPNSGRDR